MTSLKKVCLIGLTVTIGAGAIYGAPGLFGEPPTASAQERAARAHIIQDDAQQDLRHVYHLQQIARKQKDVIKLNCVNDKLVLIRPQVNLLERAVSELMVSSSAAGMFGEVAQAGQNVHRLREEADQCTGEPLTGTESSNLFTGPLVPDDPYTNPWGGRGTIEPPGYASPFN